MRCWLFTDKPTASGMSYMSAEKGGKRRQGWIVRPPVNSPLPTFPALFWGTERCSRGEYVEGENVRLPIALDIGTAIYTKRPYRCRRR